ncbi:MAG: arylesterase [Candidatus Latescibacterota bacterium]|nr:arylesterase [Candidatus Latescibacterota bacterium]
MSSRPSRILAAAALTLVTGLATQTSASRKVILFFGDSLTAGYQVGRAASFPSVVQARIDSLGLHYEVANAGLSGETSAAGLRRIDWVLQRPIDVFVLELGGNDGLRGVALESTEENLRQILTRVRVRYPKAALVVAGVRLPPNLGLEYTEQFRGIFPKLAAEFDAVLISRLLDRVGGDLDLTPDGIHPTVEGHRLVANTVWDYLGPLLKRLETGAPGSADEAASEPTSTGSDSR